MKSDAVLRQRYYEEPRCQRGPGVQRADVRSLPLCSREHHTQPVSALPYQRAKFDNATPQPRSPADAASGRTTVERADMRFAKATLSQGGSPRVSKRPSESDQDKVAA